ncbi:MAG: cysteine desulfurase [Elusimicrobia bacterium]|nr:cysteine desulfurase [Elusimicrobiota bacterium]
MNLSKIRRDFPILSRSVRGKPLVYFDNAATSQKPQAVLDALLKYYREHNANVHRGIHTLAEEATDQMQKARSHIASFLRAPDPSTIVFTRNATEAINLVAHSWGKENIRPGDQILLSEMEHHSNLLPWQFLAVEKQAELLFIPMGDDFTLDLEAAQRLLASGRIKLVAVTACSNVLGTLNPVPELVRMAHRAGATILIDGAQWAPHLPTDLQAWDCDFFACSAHKMLGPTGVGILYGRRVLLDRMPPFLGGGGIIREVERTSATFAEVPMKFEAGTPHIAGIIAFDAALDYLESIGMDQIQEHEKSLTAPALKRLREDPEVTLYSPSDPGLQGGVLSFNLRGIHPHDLGTILDSVGVAIRAGHHCSQILMKRLNVSATARASFYLYNTEEELDTFFQGIEKAKRIFSRGRLITH